MRAVVIGSGISGLTAGLMLLRDGHQVWILEQFPTPGGVTAAVSKDGFTWELGQLVLEGLGRDEQLGYVLDELGIYDRLELKRNDRIYSFPDFVIRPPEEYAGPWWRMEKLAELFPEDRTGLEEYCRMYVRFREVVTLARLAERAGGLRGLALKARMYRKLLPLLPRAKWSAERMGAHLFSSEQLQAVFMSILADFVVRPSQFPGLGIPAVNPEPAFDARVPLQVSAVGRQPSYHSIVGGVNALVEVLVDEITSAGGKISTGTEVSRIRVEDGVVKGVTCADGAEIDADLVLASGGAKEVFLDLVGEDSLPEAYVAQIHDVPLMESIFMVHLGVDFDPVPHQQGDLCYYYQTYDIEGGVERVQSGDYHEGRDGFLLYIPSAHSPQMAPEGHHAVTVYTIAPDTLAEGSWADRAEEYADKLLVEAEKYVPGLREHTKTRMIITPEDWRRRAHVSHHSFGGCAPVMGKSGMPHETPVAGLWFIGAQSQSGAGINNVVEGVWRCNRMIRKAPRKIRVR